MGARPGDAGRRPPRAGHGARAGSTDGGSVDPPLGVGRVPTPLVARDVPHRRGRPSVTELLPLKAAFGPTEDARVELRGFEAPTNVRLWHLDELVDETVSDSVAAFGQLPAGGYGVEAAGARTAFEVEGRTSSLRYGFGVDFASGREVDALVENVRRLHLNAVMFYDWMYRHAQLLPESDLFDDPLGRPLSLETVKRLASALQATGAAPIAYAAIYAVGPEQREQWAADALLHADGAQWQLGDDFLFLVDPSSPRWLAHLGGELRRARSEIGFAGFHLDQFGWPKAAIRPDGALVDLATAFRRLIEHVRHELDDATLVFNNVNDFPTYETASAPQDAIYIEVWSPHDSLEDLANLVVTAKLYAPDKPVCLAAYLSTLPADEEGGAEAMRFVLATTLSRGGTCLLHGEERALLIDPYYVRHHVMSPVTATAAQAYADFTVRYSELLFGGGIDVTQTHWGGINEEITVETTVPVSAHAVSGALWIRAVESERGLLVHLVDLSSQNDVAWDSPKTPSTSPAIKLAVDRIGREPAFHAASPETSPALTRLESAFDGRYDVVQVPTFAHWALIWVRRADVGGVPTPTS